MKRDAARSSNALQVSGNSVTLAAAESQKYEAKREEMVTEGIGPDLLKNQGVSRAT